LFWLCLQRIKAEIEHIIPGGKAYLTKGISVVIYILFPGGLLDKKKTQLVSSSPCSK